MDNNSINQHKHIEVLDGLRGIAILVVVWYHTWQLSWLSTRTKIFSAVIDLDFIGRNGYIGVELFFFISGTCLTLPYVRAALSKEAAPNLSGYTYRRAIKILPSYIFAITILLLFRHQTFNSLNDYFWHITSHLLFIHNWFQETTVTINGVFWSLAVEIQFYLIFPLLIQIFIRHPFGVYGGLCGTAVLYRAWVLIGHSLEFGYWMNQLPSFLDCFASGMLTAYLIHKFKQQDLEKYRVKFTIAAIIISCLILAVFYQADLVRYEQLEPFLSQIKNRWPLTLLFMGLTIFSALGTNFWRKILANRCLVFLSLISYNLYIWHQVIGRELVKHHFPMSATLDPHDDPQWKLIYTLITLVASIGFSFILTYGLERPLLKRKPTLSVNPSSPSGAIFN